MAAKIAGRVVGNIGVSSSRIEGKLRKSIQDSVNRIVKGSGIPVSETAEYGR